MLQRFALQFLLIFLFAFAQIGVFTHEISHYSDLASQHQQDQNTAAEQCAQCITYAQVASGLQAQPFILPTFDAHFAASTHYFFNTLTRHSAVYSARAPPITLNS